MSRYNHRYIGTSAKGVDRGHDHLGNAAVYGAALGVLLGTVMMFATLFFVTPSQSPRATPQSTPCLSPAAYAAYEAWAVSQGLMTLTSTETGR